MKPSFVMVSTGPFGPGVYKALHDIRLSQLNGNMASMYADAKIREILSLFLAGQEEENYLHCSCTIGITCDKIHHARAIIEQEYHFASWHCGWVPMNVRLSEDLRQYLVQPYLVTSLSIA